MKLPFLSEVIAESMWRAMGWVQAFIWRSTKRWQSTKAVQMKQELYNHTRRKHMRGGCVWDKVATEWPEMNTWLVKEQDAK